MKNKLITKFRAASCAAIVALALSTPQAHATLLDFAWSDSAGDTASWTMDSSPTPHTVLSNEAFIPVISGTDYTVADGDSSFSNIAIYPSSNGGGFYTGDAEITAHGDQIYTGSLDAPVFAPGTYSTSSLYGTLVVTAESDTSTPEPVSLTLLVSGLVGLGLVRRVRTLRD